MVLRKHLNKNKITWQIRSDIRLIISADTSERTRYLSQRYPAIAPHTLRSTI